MRPAVMIVAIGTLALFCVPALAKEAASAGLAKVPRASLPPGDVKGTLLESDGVTPLGNVKVTLRDLKTDEEVMSAMADEKGKYVLENVAAGEYTVYVGNSGLATLLKVSEGAEAGVLDLHVPKALLLPSPKGLPKATTHSPGCTWSESPNSRVCTSGGRSSTLITARSLSSSVPTISALASRPS